MVTNETHARWTCSKGHVIEETGEYGESTPFRLHPGRRDMYSAEKEGLTVETKLLCPYCVAEFWNQFAVVEETLPGPPQALLLLCVRCKKMVLPRKEVIWCGENIDRSWLECPECGKVIKGYGY